MSYKSFKTLFMAKTNKILISTITNSKKREADYLQSGNTMSAAVEVDRRQAAADVLTERGYYGSTKQGKPTPIGAAASAKVDYKVLAIVGLGVAFFWMA